MKTFANVKKSFLFVVVGVIVCAAICFLTCTNIDDGYGMEPFTFTLTTNAEPASGGGVIRILSYRDTVRNLDQYDYPAGTRVTIIAEAAAGYWFSGWSGSTTSNAIRQEITVNGNRTLTANFTRYGEFIDQRDNQLYYTVEMPDGKTWMAQNLNYETESGSWCHNNADSMCVIYGRYYVWATAMNIDTSCNTQSLADCGAIVTGTHQGICPEGWRLPHAEEWETLIDSVGGGRELVLRKLSSHSWNNGTNDFGFSALPGGGWGNHGNWWSATKVDTNACYMSLSSALGDGYVAVRCGYFWGFSGGNVRCVKSNEEIYTLTTNASPTNGGRVSRSPDQTTYTPGTEVTVTATPRQHSRFTGWTGTGAPTPATTNPVTVVMDDNFTLIANFEYTVAPSAPTNVRAELRDDSTGISVRWEYSDGGYDITTGYRIYRSTDSLGLFSLIGTSTSTSSYYMWDRVYYYYIDEDVLSSMTYFYRVTAYNNVGESPNSNTSRRVTTSAFIIDFDNQFNHNITYGEFTDPRDNQTYRTVVMPDGKTWMAENLNFNPGGAGNSSCVNNDCYRLGRLYDVNTATTTSGPISDPAVAMRQGICPFGWHVPSQEEWNELAEAVGGMAIAGTKLKSRGWLISSSGTDDYGFSALPNSGVWGGMWVSRDGSAFRVVPSEEQLRSFTISSSNVNNVTYSVRCVKTD